MKRMKSKLLREVGDAYAIGLWAVRRGDHELERVAARQLVAAQNRALDAGVSWEEIWAAADIALYQEV